MRSSIMMAAFILAAAAWSASARAECSIRGNYCGYPLWAANAFEDWGGRVNPATGPVLPGSLEKRDYDKPRRTKASRSSNSYRSR